MRGLTRRLRRGSERKAPSAPQAQLPFPDEGLTRRLRRGRWGCHPEGGSTFFRSERKYQRKHAARRLREKALYCPFLKEGVRNVARNIVGEITLTFVRARAHSFPLSKRARLFPSAAYRRSAPPQLAVGRLKWRCLRCIDAAGMVSQRGKTGLIFFCGWRRAYSSSAAVDISTYFGYFCNAKSQRGFETTLAFLCEP